MSLRALLASRINNAASHAYDRVLLDVVHNIVQPRLNLHHHSNLTPIPFTLSTHSLPIGLPSDEMSYEERLGLPPAVPDAQTEEMGGKKKKKASKASNNRAAKVRLCPPNRFFSLIRSVSPLPLRCSSSPCAPFFCLPHFYRILLLP